MEYALLFAGLVLLVKGGDIFVDAAVGLAAHFHIPHVLIGATVISLATTSPEISLSLLSGLEGDSRLAFGNAVGSVACNSGLIGGLIFLLSTPKVKGYSLGFSSFIFGASAVVVCVLGFNGHLRQWEGGALICFGVLFFSMDALRHLIRKNPDEEQQARDQEEEAEAPQSRLKCSLLFFLGALLVLGGSRILVHNALIIAKELGVSSAVMGLTVVAVGTSLPELVTAWVSTRKGTIALSLGNILGSNVSNLTLALGASTASTPLTLNQTELWFQNTVLLIFSGALLYVLLVRPTNPKKSAGLLLGLYLIYLVTLVPFVISDKA